jgi:hypothetical protein
MSNFDPNKLLPLVIAVGVFVLAALGKLNTQELLFVLAGNQALHAGISSLTGK